MNSDLLTCLRCRAQLSPAIANATQPTHCASCGAAVDLAVFPALLKPPEKGSAGEALLVDDHSSCYYHADKTATVVCEGCGRFLCSLCAIDLNDRRLCTTCLEAGGAKGELHQLTTRRTRYDSLALTLSIVVVLVWPFVVITAPYVVYLCIRHWNTPSSLVHSTRWRFVLALAISLIEILGIAAIATIIIMETVV